MKGRVVIAAVAAAALVTTPGMTQQDRRPDLVMSGLAEPPDQARPGDQFVNTFTVSNEGRRRARGRSITRGYLSTGRHRGGGDDIRLEGQRRTRPIRAGAQAMGRVKFVIPTRTPDGRYYLILCADATDVVEESQERYNCRSSGQSVTVSANPPAGNPGPPGAAGPPGPKGEPGPPGGGADFRRLPVVRMAPAGDETEESEVLQVGPLVFQYQCTNDADDSPSDTARIRVRTTGGAFSLRRDDDAPTNVAPGSFVTVMETIRKDGMNPERDDPATTTTDESTGGGSSGFKAGRTFIGHDDGTELVVDSYTGIDTLGAAETGPGNEDGCVFGGRVTVLP